jgi:hypothetical protein
MKFGPDVFADALVQRAGVPNRPQNSPPKTIPSLSDPPRLRAVRSHAALRAMVIAGLTAQRATSRETGGIAGNPLFPRFLSPCGLATFTARSPR